MRPAVVRAGRRPRHHPVPHGDSLTASQWWRL